MSLELVNTLATFGTFMVIAGTAIAAIIQLRHSRSSNQIEAYAGLRQVRDASQMQPAQQFVRHDLSDMLKDPAFRYQLNYQQAMTPENQPLWNHIRRVGNYYEGMGLLVKSGLADRKLVLDDFSNEIVVDWKSLVPIVAIRRQATGIKAIWENFEYLTVLAQDWLTSHPDGTYPAGVRRIDLQYPWLEADKQYAASLAPA
jgi:Domain of unknown function (DUF4760)